MHAFRIVSPFPVAQLRFMCLLAELHQKPNQKTLTRLHNQAHVVQTHCNATWGKPSHILAQGLTAQHIHLTEPFAEYMRLQIEALFITVQGPASLRSPRALKMCDTIDVLMPRLRITFTYAAVIIQGVGHGELVDSDAHFEELIQGLIDMRTELRVALLMALHPRLGNESPLGCVGEDVMRMLCNA